MSDEINNSKQCFNPECPQNQSHHMNPTKKKKKNENTWTWVIFIISIFIVLLIILGIWMYSQKSISTSI